MTVTKNELIESIWKNTGLSKIQARGIVETLFETIKKNLEEGEDILISGFGKFCVRGKKPRRGRNPQTGEDMMLDSRRVVTFKPSGVLRDKINRS